MNKQCTNSSCRKTFSTLIYGGICPFCGKVYPQLQKERYRQGITLWIDDKCFPLKLDEIDRYRRNGQRMKGVNACRQNLQRYGYEVSIRDALYLYDSLPSKLYCLNRWRSVLNPATGKRKIVPVYRNIEQRLNVKVLNFCVNGNELFLTCEGDGDTCYGLMKDRIVMDNSRVSSYRSYILLSEIKNAELIDMPGQTQENHAGVKCLRITLKSTVRLVESKGILLIGRSEEFIRFAQSVLKLV